MIVIDRGDIRYITVSESSTAGDCVVIHTSLHVNPTDRKSPYKVHVFTMPFKEGAAYVKETYKITPTIVTLP